MLSSETSVTESSDNSILTMDNATLLSRDQKDVALPREPLCLQSVDQPLGIACLFNKAGGIRLWSFRPHARVRYPH
jgi:hypothetical protein